MAKKPTRVDALESKIEELHDQLEALSTSGLPEVKMQVRHAEIQSELWRTKQVKADLTGSLRDSIDCTREAHKWEEQKTRAIKYSIADRLTALEKMATERGAVREGLKLLAGGG